MDPEPRVGGRGSGRRPKKNCDLCDFEDIQAVETQNHSLSLSRNQGNVVHCIIFEGAIYSKALTGARTSNLKYDNPPKFITATRSTTDAHVLSSCRHLALPHVSHL
jgi:hypothetical protein